MSSNKMGPYANTKVTSTGYLDILKPRPVPAAKNDVLWEITSTYTHRPDLLAYDLYGTKDLWWVFAQRNADKLKDPVYDFEPGLKIYLPQGENLRKKLGL